MTEFGGALGMQLDAVLDRVVDAFDELVEALEGSGQALGEFEECLQAGRRLLDAARVRDRDRAPRPRR